MPVTQPGANTSSSPWRGMPGAFGRRRACCTSVPPPSAKNSQKEPDLPPVHHPVLASLHPAQVAVESGGAEELEVRRGLSAERDAMWSFVPAKAQPRGLWHAMEHHPGTGRAYVFGRRKDAVGLKWPQLLEPLGITNFDTDGGGADERHIEPKKPHVGKENTQHIERKHLNVRTRIKRLMRRTIGFSKTEQMHALVIGLFSHRYEFGQAR
jgi:insertion element IS1 protein InsB